MASKPHCENEEVNTVHYLGHVVGGGHPDEEKVQALCEYLRPVTKKDVRAYMGLVGYYRRFIFKLFNNCYTSYQPDKKGHPDTVVWSKDCQVAFQHLKDAVIEDLVLQITDPNRPFKLQTDASDRGLGAVLSQVDTQGEEHPVAYSSLHKQKLFPGERKY